MFLQRRAALVLAPTLAAAAAAAQTDQEPSGLVERGAYLAAASHCASCHTAPDGARYAGGFRLETPFGALITPNITPDPETGIGGWSREQFAAALREGVGDEGDPLYPAMPYLYFTRITDEDIDALWAYFRSVEPAANEVEVNQLPFPYNVRASLRGWKLLFFEEGRFEPEAGRDAAFNRGKYLVEALGHCGSCHTPRNALGAPIEDAALKGALVREWYAPNISNDARSVMREWSVEALAEFLAEGHGQGNVTVFGSMEPVVDESLSRMTGDDLRAIAVYLTTRDAAPAEPPEIEAAALDPAMAALGERVYALNCENCHGEDGEGRPGVAASLVDNGAVTASKPHNVIAAVLEGFPADGAWGAMPSFAEQLGDVEIAAVANYVRDRWGNDAPANATPGMAREWRGLATIDEEKPRGVLCPNVPAERLDDETLAALRELDPNAIAATELEDLAARYRDRHPGLGHGEAVLALYAGFCRIVAEEAPSQGARLAMVGDFSQAVSRAMAVVEQSR